VARDAGDAGAAWEQGSNVGRICYGQYLSLVSVFLGPRYAVLLRGRTLRPERERGNQSGHFLDGTAFVEVPARTV
jgi:hypothetical protein